MAKGEDDASTFGIAAVWQKKLLWKSRRHAGFSNYFYDHEASDSHGGYHVYLRPRADAHSIRFALRGNHSDVHFGNEAKSCLIALALGLVH